MSKPHPTYELFEEIGRGEYSVVYRAHDVTLGRDVAIKELNESGRGDPSRRQKFLREAQFLAQHQHPGILGIHAVDAERGWIVMELMQGTLEAQIQQAALPAETVRSILRQLLPALDFLHSRHKIHGSIRPSNILIDDRGTVKLSDFEETTIDGELRAPMHSKKYVSPELIRSEFGQLGPTADLYCLGFTAFELLAGPNFDALTVEAMGASVDPNVGWLRWHSGSQPNPSVKDSLPSLPEDLALTLDVMLHKEVAQRCPSAAAALKQLTEQAVVPVEPIVAPSSQRAAPGILPANVRELPPPSTPQAAQRRPSAELRRAPSDAVAFRPPQNSRDRLNAILGKWYVLYPLCAVLLLGALGIGLSLQTKKQEVAVVDPPGQEPAPQENAKSKAGLPQETPTPGEGDAPTTSEATTPDALPTPEGSDPSLANVPQPDATDATGAGGTVGDSRSPPEENALTENTAGKTGVGETSLQPSIEVVPPDPNATPPTPADLAKSEAPLAGENPNAALNAQLLDLVSAKVNPQPLLEEFKGKAELVIDGGGFMSEITDLAISPDGQLLAASGGKVVRIWNLSNGRLVETLRGDRNRASYGDCYSLAFSPDGQYLLVGVNDYREHGSIRVYRTDRLDEIEQLLPGHRVPVRHVAFSDDGQQLASVDADGFIALWDWATRKIVQRLPPRDAEAPIYDALQFSGSQDILFGIDFGGPVLYSTPSLIPPAVDDLPASLRAWMIDIFGHKLTYPFATSQDPRLVDLRLEHQLWAAAGVGREQGSNKFWVGVWPTRSVDAPTVAAPRTIYAQHRWNVTALSLAPEHGIAASGDRFGEIHVWDIDSGKEQQRFVGQGKPIYEAAFDRNSQHIVFGTTAFQPDRWGSNSYGQPEHVLDLAARTIRPIDSGRAVEPIGEVAQRGPLTLRSRLGGDQSAMRVEKRQQERTVSSYEFTSGRLPTVFSLLDRPVLGVQEPVALADDLGLLAIWDSATDELRRAFIGHDGLVSSVSVSPDKSLLLSSSADRTIRLWSLADYRPTGIFDFKFENSKVTRVSPSTSSAKAGVQIGDRIVTIDGKSMKEMYELMLQAEFDYPPGAEVEVEMQREEDTYRYKMTLGPGYDFSEPILSVYFGEDNSWIIWTPQGYYDCSPGADQLIGWHINRGPEKSANYYEVQQFRKQLYRPDVINRLLLGDSLPDAIARADQDLLREDAMDFRSPSDLAYHHPPVIEFRSPPAGSQLNSAEVRLQATVKSVNGLPIREVTLLLNGLTDEVLVPENPNAQEFEIDRLLSLQSGENEVALIAANAEATSAAETLFVQVAREVPTSTRRMNLLAIGISDYATADDRLDLLPHAAADARHFAATAVTQAAGKLYSEVQTRVIQNADANRTEILQGMQWLVDNTQDGDTAVIFLSAYCFLDSTANFYVGTHEVDMSRPRATAISWREFIKTLHEDLPSCRRLVFLDLQPTEQAIAPGQRNPLLDLAAPELATTFFSSTALQQTRPLQPNRQRGYLTEALAHVLHDPASDVEPQPTDNLLSNSEVSQAWQSQFRRLTAGKLFPVAYVPAGNRRHAVFDLTNIK